MSVTTPFVGKLVRRQDVAEGTTAFHFEKPAGFAFAPGQFLEVTLLAPPETDAEGDKRPFSIASAPGEPTLMVATRMRDTAFKRVLGSLSIGAHVLIDGPFGELTLDDDTSRAAVILAGGIGITPFRSMLVDAAMRRLSRTIFAFDANRRPEDAPFLDELLTLEHQNPRCKFFATMTNMTKSSRHWNGDVGKIDAELIARHAKGAVRPIYYVAGPPAMVRGLHAMLRAAHVDDDDIRSEEFDGY